MANEKSSSTPLCAETLWMLFFRTRNRVERALIVAGSAAHAEQVGRAHCEKLTEGDIVGRGVVFVRVEPAVVATSAILRKTAPEPEAVGVGQ